MNHKAVKEVRRTIHIFNCACHGDVPMLEGFLKQNGLDVDQRDINGKTALYLATDYNQVTAVKTLIAAGANVEAAPTGGCPSLTPVMIAAEFGHIECLRALALAGADVNKLSPTEETPMTLAFKEGNLQCAKILLSAGAKINEDAIADDDTPLLAALRHEDAEFVKALLQAGANPNIRDRDGRTILIHAASTKSAECCQLLLAHKADVKARDPLGRTPLMYAGSNQITQVLLNNEADLEARDNAGWTALVHSLKNQDSISTAISNVNTLLEHGANPVVDSCHRSVFQMLDQIWRLSNFPPHNFTLESAVSHGQKQLIRLVVCNGVVPRFPETTYGLKRYKSPIGCALHFNHNDVVKYFIANCYLTDVDLEEIHLALLRVALSRADRGVPIHVHFEDDKELSEEMGTLLHKAMCEPWPLVKLAFIAVSSALGTSPGREQRIARTCLPDRLKRMLMFQEPIARLPVSEWSNIPLCFDPVEYEAQPRPRPLLYYWPFGRTLVV